MELDLMQKSIEIAIERDVLAKEVELLRQQIGTYQTLVDALKAEAETLRQLNKLLVEGPPDKLGNVDALAPRSS